MQIIRTALDVFTAYENLIAEDARQIASGICPIRLKIVAAKVASEKVQQADEEKGRQTTQVRIERGISLLENALMRDCGAIFSIQPDGGVNYIAPAGNDDSHWLREQVRGTRFLTQAPNESMLLLDRLLLSRLEALHVAPEAIEQMAALLDGNGRTTSSSSSNSSRCSVTSKVSHRGQRRGYRPASSSSGLCRLLRCLFWKQ